MGSELKVHVLRRSLCLITDSLLEPYTMTQSLWVAFRLETESRLLWLLPNPATNGSKNSTPSDPLRRQSKKLISVCICLSPVWFLKNEVASQLFVFLVGPRTKSDSLLDHRLFWFRSPKLI